MGIDPQIQEFLDQRAEAVTPRAGTSVSEARSWDSALPRATDKEHVEDVSERMIPGPGGDLRIRVYRSSSGTLAALVFFHGGGHVVGTLETADDVCRSIANRAGCLVASVEYRLAPEHPFPAAVEDAYAATSWVAEHADELGVDVRRVAVGGSSAGGNLAAACALMARDKGGPTLAHQLLIYPTLGTDETLSRKSFAEGYYLTAESIAWYHAHYIGSPEDARSPYAAPLLTETCAGLPAATIVTAEYDPLRDEGEQYAARLQTAGVATELRRYPGVIHGFVSFAAVLDAGRQALLEIGDVLRHELASPVVAH
jgi:acetyl esterase